MAFAKNDVEETKLEEGDRTKLKLEFSNHAAAVSCDQIPGARNGHESEDEICVNGHSDYNYRGDNYQGPHDWRKRLKPVQSPAHTEADREFKIPDTDKQPRYDNLIY